MIARPIHRELKVPNLLNGLITEDDIACLARDESLVFEDADRISILKATNSIDVQACPGSGKTTLIAAKLMLLAKKWPYEDRGMCILSHTNVAKDEIINRLKKSKTIESQNLLAYPHFIGTIQEFVGKYVAFPFIRSDGTKINLVDTEVCVDLIRSKLKPNTLTYIDKKSPRSNALYNFNLVLCSGKIMIEVPTFPKASPSASYKDLHTIKNSLLSDGYFFYRDVFVYAQKALFKSAFLAPILQRRFPMVFIDEMQDTQKFQDDLLCKIFPIQGDNLSVQRFGDPDQAIFHGTSSEETNVSFNSKSTQSMDFVIHKSHRFTNNIANKIKNLSFNEISLESEISTQRLAEREHLQAEENKFINAFLIFDDASIPKVVPSFLDIISDQFSKFHTESDNFTVKIIGAVGNEITEGGQLKIGHYWATFDKKKSSNNFEGKCLIESVYYCRQRSDLDWSKNYQLLFDCVLKLLRGEKIYDSSGKYFNKTTLRDHLIQNVRWEDFQKIIYSCLNLSFDLNKASWGKLIDGLSALLKLDISSMKMKEYVTFKKLESQENNAEKQERIRKTQLVSLPDNTIQHPKGFTVELSTIHGVKGETHDATLILETKNHCFDLETMLPYIIGDLPNKNHANSDLRSKPNSKATFKPNQTFMRQLYVGMSRPKHLLSLAIHTDHISEKQKAELINSGWAVKNLTQEVE